MRSSRARVIQIAGGRASTKLELDCRPLRGRCYQLEGTDWHAGKELRQQRHRADGRAADGKEDGGEDDNDREGEKYAPFQVLLRELPVADLGIGNNVTSECLGHPVLY
jgi:hypothetical protein